jgi:hypothetical protein
MYTTKKLILSGMERMERNLTPYNITYKKLAVQWLNEALCFVSSSVVADIFVLRNRQLLVDAKIDSSHFKTTTNSQTL